VTTDKRARQKANRASRVAAAESAAAKERIRSRITTYAVGAALVVLAIVGVAILTSDDDSETVDPGITAPTTTFEAPPEPGVSAPPLGGSIDGPTPCPTAEGADERITSFAETPPMCLDEAVDYSAVLDTSLGSITIELDAENAPLTVNNFVVLSRYGFYEGAPFHRIIPDFVIQAGDAVGPNLGQGNPGYAVEDELPEAGAYEIGSVAMANSGVDTNGSQFFVVTGPQGVALPPNFSLFGTVVEGMDVVTAIEQSETTTGNAPVDNIVINSVTILEG